MLILSVGCRPDQEDTMSQNKEVWNDIPMGFPEPLYPQDNIPNKLRFELGRKLFYDPILSRNQKLSCASCHKLEFAFGDDVPVSPGVDQRLGNRNAPSIANIAYHPYFTREGGVPSLEMQVLVPVQEHAEFDFNLLRIADRLNLDSNYVSLSFQAYGRKPDPFVVTRAIACFERSIFSGRSRFDRYFFESQTHVLNPEEKLGYKLFHSERTQCSSCHSGFNFTNYAFENNGLYSDYPDPGRYRLTGDSVDLARFKVPSLRNIEITAPYMHDGSISTLEEVIGHYNSGGSSHPNKSLLIRPMDLSTQEQKALIAFLKTLTDHTLLQNKSLKP